MANIESLVNKIIEDAQREADSIVSIAQDKKSKMINIEKEKAEAEKDEILAKAKIEAQTRKERVISNAKLQVRNNKLQAKQEVMDRVFEIALEQLRNLPCDMFSKFVKTSVMSSDVDGNEKIIVNEKYKSKFNDELMNDINNSLKETGKVSNVDLSVETRDIKDGFILAKKGIELNYTFEDLMNSIREDIEGDILAVLFE
ncbi:V-type proton ATPase subunit E [Clostridium tepidiprofundi DSM 19306]|uniref:V-type proton ATPase subunit E n=1 Tax=Clostridium tepidiprofundi DSM 19306 TaxID=1121338 RepID=A0A151B5E1_9CLOT|nr:V-type ATP synthase subunit E family protein [Clostridium tepidiprofundi]KYH35020.1 V-type proton ATPase subunit E [Clostridium tepidiprofundi DSM 19306]